MSGSCYCKYFGCKNNRRSRPEISYFRFPKAEDRCRLWVQRAHLSINQPDVGQLYKFAYLCSEHFDLWCFTNENRNRLVWNAVPKAHPLCTTQPRELCLNDVGLCLDLQGPSLLVDHEEECATGEPLGVASTSQEPTGGGQTYVIDGSLGVRPLPDSPLGVVGLHRQELVTPKSRPTGKHFSVSSEFGDAVASTSEEPTGGGQTYVIDGSLGVRPLPDSPLGVVGLHRQELVTPKSRPTGRHLSLSSEFGDAVPSTSGEPTVGLKAHSGDSDGQIITPKHSTPKPELAIGTPSRPNPRFSAIKAYGLSRREVTPRKKRLLRELALMRKSVHKFKGQCAQLKTNLKAVTKLLNSSEVFKILEDNVSPTIANIVKGELRNRSRKPQGRRWSLEDKVLAVAILKRSPRCYAFLRKLVALPCRRTLLTLLDNIKFTPGINVKMLEHLAKRIEKMTEGDKYCVLLFDEMSLHSGLHYNEAIDQVIGFEDYGPIQGCTRVVANHALVFMARGLRRKWKQPVAFYFCADTTPTVILAQLIQEVVVALQGAGLNVVATVCDQGPTNRGALQALIDKTRTDKPGPFFEINGQPIVTFYDPPHLLKCLRTLLMSYNITWDFKTAKWSHIKQFYEWDKGFARMAQKLTDDHLQPEGKMKMKVSLAAQVMSHTVSAAMLTLSTFGDGSILPHEARHTAELLGDVDSLFDSFNGTTPYPEGGKKLRTQLRANSDHLTFWGDMLKKLFSWNFKRIDTGRQFQPPTVRGWIISIRSIQMLWKRLQDAGFKFLQMRRLNQDPVENLFGEIRQHGAQNTNPTCTQFMGALKTCTLNNLSSQHSRGANCEDDDGQLLSNLKSLLKDKDTSILHPQIMRHTDRSHTNPRLREKTLAQEEAALTGLRRQPVAYISGFIAKRILATSDCDVCKNAIVTQELTEDHMFISLREYDLQAAHLQYPTREMVTAVESLIELFQSNVSNHIFARKVGSTLQAIFREKVDFQWLLCNEHRNDVVSSILKLFTRISIHTYCKRRNRMLSGRSKAASNQRRMKITKHL